MEQISAEVFALTYGSLVRQLLADLEDADAVNAQLERMGYNIGCRAVDEFLAKSRTARCGSFRDAAEALAKGALRMFLNVPASVTAWSPDGAECSVVFTDNPLAEFVELPDELRGRLKYSALLAGAVRGGFEMVGMDVEARFARDMLRGDDCYELRLKLLAHRDEAFPFKEDDR